MRIAVATTDCDIVAATLETASRITVFPVDGDLIGEPEIRVISSEAAAQDGSKEPLAVELLRVISDCTVLLVQAMSDTQHSACTQIGLLPLPLPNVQTPRAAVGFVVSGVPPEAGRACGGCATLPQARITLVPSTAVLPVITR